jgi:hypothetical protein
MPGKGCVFVIEVPLATADVSAPGIVVSPERVRFMDQLGGRDCRDSKRRCLRLRHSLGTAQ